MNVSVSAVPRITNRPLLSPRGCFDFGRRGRHDRATLPWLNELLHRRSFVSETTGSNRTEGFSRGWLPDWEVAELPEPLPFSFRNAFKVIGPGAIMLAASIGGGEWLIGPATVIKHGP